MRAIFVLTVRYFIINTCEVGILTASITNLLTDNTYCSQHELTFA